MKNFSICMAFLLAVLLALDTTWETTSEILSSEQFQNRDCKIHIIGDHTFFHYHSHSLGVAVKVMKDALEVADAVFRGTDFNGDGVADQIGFQVTKASVFNGYTETGPDSYYFLKETNLSSKEVLERFSQFMSHKKHGLCLTILFVSRDFAPATTLSLAYKAEPHPLAAAGGLCSDATDRHPSIGPASANTLFVTNVNRGKALSQTALTTTIIHALGHSFGIPHDKENCNVTVESDNYIMISPSMEVSWSNNITFSNCSKLHMLPVLRNKGDCLVPHHGPRCGDGHIDTGEECDCGTIEECVFNDHCCVPDITPEVRLVYPVYSLYKRGCVIHRNVGYQCSPQASPCCTGNCAIETGSILCSYDEDCFNVSRCDGRSADCPPCY